MTEPLVGSLSGDVALRDDDVVASRSGSKGSKEKPPITSADDYTRRVAELIRQRYWQKDEISLFLQGQGDCEEYPADITAHVLNVYAANGIDDPAIRAKMIEAAAAHQHKLLSQRRNLKKERLREASMKAAGSASEKDRTVGDAVLAAVGLKKSDDDNHSVLADRLKWTTVQAFHDYEEALQFIVECQPVNYLPLVGDSKALNIVFQNNKEAYAYIQQMNPPPTHFVSAALASSMVIEESGKVPKLVGGVEDFKRQLRIRKLDHEEVREHLIKAFGGKSHSRRRSITGRSAGNVNKVQDAQISTSLQYHMQKPFLVEASGPLFEVLEDVRELSKPPGPVKYYIAVAETIQQKILQEGYRVTRRFSIPCCGTPHEALHAFSVNEQRSGRQPQAAVALAVSVPANIDVVKHKVNGFLIRAQELPASCFSKRRIGGGASEGA